MSGIGSVPCPMIVRSGRSGREPCSPPCCRSMLSATESSVLIALSACALTEPGLQPAWREVDGTIRDVCAQALRTLGVRGDVVVLDHLHTFMNGLVAQLMNRGEDRSPQWALTALDRELQRYGS